MKPTKDKRRPPASAFIPLGTGLGLMIGALIGAFSENQFLVIALGMGVGAIIGSILYALFNRD